MIKALDELFNEFFEFETEDRSAVSSTSCKLFADHCINIVINLAIKKWRAERENLLATNATLQTAITTWVKIDYGDESTLPELSKPCLVAWDSDFKKQAGSPPQTWERLAMRIKTDDCDDDGCTWLWADYQSGDFEDFDKNPTHWCYAPKFEGI